MDFCNDESWTILSPIEKSIKEKIEKIGTPLKDWGVSINRGILTGYNDAFIISGTVKDELIHQDAKSADLIRPILRGRDIKRYGYNFANLWVINTHNGIKDQGIKRIDVEEYPAIKRHLDEHYEKLAKRADKGDTPYNLRNCAYMEDFSKQKIVWGNLCLSAQFAYAENDFFINAPATMIVPGSKYLLAVLNSKLADWYIRQLGVTRNGGYFEYKPMFVECLPVPNTDSKNKKPLENLVDSIIHKKSEGKDTSKEEKEIDAMIYDLYGLTIQEKRYIELESH